MLCATNQIHLHFSVLHKFFAAIAKNFSFFIKMLAHKKTKKKNYNKQRVIYKDIGKWDCEKMEKPEEKRMKRKCTLLKVSTYETMPGIHNVEKVLFNLKYDLEKVVHLRFDSTN